MKRPTVILLIAIAALVIASLALAQVTDFGLPRYRIAGGGGTAGDGARFSLAGLIGQPEAGAMSDGSSLVLSGGYWGGRPPAMVSSELYLPLLFGP